MATNSDKAGNSDKHEKALLSDKQAQKQSKIKVLIALGKEKAYLN